MSATTKPVNQKAWFLILPVILCVAFSAILPLMTPPATMPFVPVTQTAPSAIALATPGVPDPADAGAMRIPTPVTVPPPLVPISGSGGGFTSTPS